MGLEMAYSLPPDETILYKAVPTCRTTMTADTTMIQKNKEQYLRSVKGANQPPMTLGSLICTIDAFMNE